MKIVGVKQLSQELNLNEEILYKELLEALKDIEGKVSKKYFLNETEKKVFVIAPQDIKIIQDGYNKLSLISLAEHFKIDAEVVGWLIEELYKKQMISKEVHDYYTGVRGALSFNAWFEPAEINAGEETTLTIEVSSIIEIEQPKLTISKPSGIELEYEPKPPLKFSPGKRVEKYKYKGARHGRYKVDVEFEGLTKGIKYGPEKVTIASLRVKPLPPELYIEAYPSEASTFFKQDLIINLRIYNKGLGEARNIKVEGLENYQEFDILSSREVGNLASYGRIEYPLRMKPKKSGKYTFDKLILIHEDAEGKAFSTTIPSFTVNVRTLKPELKTELITPPLLSSRQVFPLTVRIMNIGEGEARNVSFDLPVDSKIIMSGYVSCSVPRLRIRASEEIAITLQAPEGKELRINDFDIRFMDVEGTPMTHKCFGVVIPVRKVVEEEALKEALVEWPFSPGNVIRDRYHIIKEIREGGFARVYLAEDSIMKRKIALKALKTDFIIDPVMVDQFTEEAKIAIDLQNPNIIRVYDVDKEVYAGKAYPYIVMEYISGGTLQEQLLPGKPMNLIDASKVQNDICLALSFAHQQNIIHCDVKPSNIFFDKDKDTWKLGDFGLAKIMRGREALSRGGTPTYIAPEVREGKATEKSDIYSLGVVFREILTSNPRGDLSRLKTTYKQIDQSRFDKLIDLIERMTSPSPDQRPSLTEVFRVVRWSRSW